MLRWVVRAAVSVSVVAVLVSVASASGLREAFAEVSGAVWMASLAVFLAGHALNAAKYRWLLKDPHATLGLCLRAHFSGLVANLGLPGVAGGDVVRATYLLPHGVNGTSATVASVLDRLIDTATLGALIGGGALVAGLPPALRTADVRIRWSLLAAGGVGAALLAGGLVVVARRRGTSLGGTLARLAGHVRERAGAIGAAVAVTATVQSAFVMTNVWLARDLGLDIGVAPWFVAWPLSKIIAILPISLGGIGVREAALVSLLSPFGAPSALVFAAGLLWQGVLITSGLVGLAVGSALGVSRARLASTPQRP
ncbi:MAG: YbhN family protein [Vicinamibacterales bacterium]